MATNQIKTRILNKISTWSEWQAVKSTFKPLRGEICIVEIPTDTTGTGLTPPAVGIKVGNGTDFFEDLPWIQAVAGDVPAYVKGIVDQAALNALIDQYKVSDGTTIKAAITALQNRVKNLEDTVGSATSGLVKDVADLQGTVSGHTTSISNLTNNKVNTNVAETATATDKLVKESTVNSKISAAKTALLGTDGVEGTHTIKGAYAAAAAADTKAGNAATAAGQAQSTADTAEANAQKGITNAAAAQKKADDAYTLADTANQTANANAGNITTIQGQITEINEALGGTDGTSVSARLGALETLTGKHTTDISTNATGIKNNSDAIDVERKRINTLVGDDTGKSVRAVAAEETAKIVAGADTNYDTLKEIADWIKSDTTGAAEMANDISEMQGLLGVTEGEALPKTVQERIEDAIAAENLSQYATDTDLNNATNRIQNIEDNYATKAYADQAEADAVSTVVGASANASTANTIYGAKKYAEEKAAAALADAKSYADTAESDAIASAKSYTDGKVATINTTTNNISSRIDTITGSAVENGNGVISTLGFNTSGDDKDKLVASRRLITMDDMSDTATFVFYCGTATEVV